MKDQLHPEEERFGADFNKVLVEDMQKCACLLDGSDLPFARRMFFRACFAFFEGLIYSLKRAAIPMVCAKGLQTGNYAISKLATLNDVVYRPDARGKLNSEPNRLPFLNECSFVIRTIAECVGLDPAPLFGDDGWNRMQSALKVRHRITHPKSAADLDINREDLDALVAARAWLLGAMVSVMNAPEGDELARILKEHPKGHATDEAEVT